eukprot:Hpha_TRINITY_DN18358_c0_g1::TRINITY_DN18358_c0_g1_i1::g.158188::m.158188
MTGPCLHGNILGGRRRWATVVGGCIELSLALAEEAELKEEYGMVAGAVGEYCAVTKLASRFGHWEELSSRTVLTTWKLDRVATGSLFECPDSLSPGMMFSPVAIQQQAPDDTPFRCYVAGFTSTHACVSPGGDSFPPLSPMPVSGLVTLPSDAH